MQAAAIAINTDHAASRWNWKFFKNSAKPDFILETEQSLTPEIASLLQTSWNEKFAGEDNSHKTAILHSGLSAKNLSPSQKEMDFVESRKFNRDEIL